MKIIKWSFILALINFNACCFADQLLYKCSDDNKSMVYYKNMNNDNVSNGWYEVSNFPCNPNLSFLNTTCDKNGVIFIVDSDGNQTSSDVLKANCSKFTLGFPETNLIN